MSCYQKVTYQAFGKGLSEIFAQAFFQKACQLPYNSLIPMVVITA